MQSFVSNLRRILASAGWTPTRCWPARHRGIDSASEPRWPDGGDWYLARNLVAGVQFAACAPNLRFVRLDRSSAWFSMAFAVIGECRPTVPSGVESRLQRRALRGFEGVQGPRPPGERRIRVAGSRRFFPITVQIRQMVPCTPGHCRVALLSPSDDLRRGMSSLAAATGQGGAPRRVPLLWPVASALWFRFPRRVGALSPSMSVLLRDGDWTASIPVLGAIMLPASLITGMVVATSQSSLLWAYDFWPAPVMLAMGALGAGPGVWAAFGYLIGLLFFWHNNEGRGWAHVLIGQSPSYTYLRDSGHGIFYSFTHTALPVIVVAMVLLQLAVIVPAVAAACRGLISRPLRRHRKIRTLVEGVLSAMIIALLAYQWQLAAQYAIRAFWTINSAGPDAAAFDMLRSLGWSLCVVAVIISVLRWTATLLLPRHPALLLPRGTMKRIELPWPLTVAGQALLVTLLAAGVLATVSQSVFFFEVVAGGLIVRTMVLPRIPGFARVVNLVPAAIRIVLLFVVAYLISKQRVGAAYVAHVPDVTSFAETAGLVILASAVVLVAREPRPWLPSWVHRRRQRPKDAPGVPGRQRWSAGGPLRCLAFDHQTALSTFRIPQHDRPRLVRRPRGSGAASAPNPG